MNLEKAVRICRVVESHLSNIGYHVGLTGGCLYKDAYRKDVDIIVYPHSSHEKRPIKELLEFFQSVVGWRYFTEGSGKRYGDDDKEVHKFGIGSGYVDVFFLS